MHQKQIVKDAFFLLAVIIFILVAGVVDAEEPLPNANADILSFSGAADLSSSALQGISVSRGIGNQGGPAPNSLGMATTGVAQTGVSKGVIANPALGTGAGSPIGMVTPKTTYRSGSFQ